MLRNIHYFSIKPGADAERMLHLLDNEFAAYSETFGCLERKTWKLLDVHNWDDAGQATPSLGTYVNESLWPSQAEADAFTRASTTMNMTPATAELFSGVTIFLTVRYIDDEG